jgi:hypothetical protein
MFKGTDMKTEKLDFTDMDAAASFILSKKSYSDMKLAYNRLKKKAQKYFRENFPNFYYQFHHTQAHVRQARKR